MESPLPTTTESASRLASRVAKKTEVSGLAEAIRPWKSVNDRIETGIGAAQPAAWAEVASGIVPRAVRPMVTAMPAASGDLRRAIHKHSGLPSSA